MKQLFRICVTCTTVPVVPSTLNLCSFELQLLENPFLKNDLVDTMNFLEDLSIKEPSEKNKFFRSLPGLIPSFPDVVCTRKLLPLIASALSYGGAPALALGCLLQVCSVLHLTLVLEQQLKSSRSRLHR